MNSRQHPQTANAPTRRCGHCGKRMVLAGAYVHRALDGEYHARCIDPALAARNGPKAFAILNGPAAPIVVTSAQQLSELHGWPLKSCEEIFARSSPPVTVVRIPKYPHAPGEPIRLTDEQIAEWRAGR